MTMKLHTTVERRPRPWAGGPDPLPWRATVVARERESSLREAFRTARAASHPEALQAAQVLRAELDAELMDEVHASRASRRQPAPSCPSCHDDAPALGHDPRAAGCTFHRADVHTVEAP